MQCDNSTRELLRRAAEARAAAERAECDKAKAVFLKLAAIWERLAARIGRLHVVTGLSAPAAACCAVYMPDCCIAMGFRC